MSLAVLLVAEGWRIERAFLFRNAAAKLAGTIENRDREVAFRELAAQIVPESAPVHVEVAEAHLRLYQEELGRLQTAGRVSVVAHVIAESTSPASVLNALFPLTVPGQRVASAAWEAATGEAQQGLVRRHMVPALRNCLEARAVCPLMAKPHILLAAGAPYLSRSEPALVHLGRAKQIVTNDPQLWLVFGHQELLSGQFDRACASWHRSLELSDQNLALILELGKNSLGPQRLANDVVPEQPTLLLRAAAHLYPHPESTAERRPFLEKALSILKARPGPLKPADHYLYAKIHEGLGQTDEALAEYREALDQDPRQLAWRFELAQILRSRGQLNDSRREIILILRQQPKDVAARDLLAEVDHELLKEGGKFSTGP
jgi:tetratricopeptide (TPR) repeat protein